MIFRCRHLVVVLVLWTTLLTLKASDDVTTMETPQEGETETSQVPDEGYNTEAYNTEAYNSGERGHSSGSNEGYSTKSVSFEESSNEKTYSSNLSPRSDSEEYGNRVPAYHGYYGRYSMRQWIRPKWEDFEDSRRNVSEAYWRLDFLWPHQENRWSSPQHDRWNLFSTKCNKVDAEDIPDRPRATNDQASSVHERTHPKLASTPVNVSAYDIYKERCCSGKTYPKYPNGHFACCGSSDYDTLREVCCEGKTYSQERGYECCGERYINTDLHICCYHPESGTVAKPWPGNALKSNETRLFSQCCGVELYDTRTHVCFLVTSLDDVSVKFTVIENKYHHTGCCEGKPYDQDKGTCDETGKVYTFMSGPPCVFKKAYEVVRELRHSGITSKYGPFNWYEHYRHNRHYYDHYEGRLELCGSEIIDPYTETCCVDRYGKEKNGTTKVWKIRDGTNWRCCGTELYIHANQTCCNGRVHDEPVNVPYGCCGQELYHPINQWCCKGSNKIKESNINGDACCGTEGLTFRTDSHVCCNNSLAEIPKDSNYRYYRGWECCGDKAFSPHQEKCCNGVVHDVDRYERRRYECCGTDLVDGYSRYTCCGGKVYKDHDMSCCNNEPYNSNTHACCGGTVVESSPHADFCCGKVPYNNKIHTCCLKDETNEWLLYSKKSKYESCCGGRAYNIDMESCCGDSPGFIVNDEKSLCCRTYDPVNGNHTYAAVDNKPNAKSSSCCGLLAYDIDNEICCNDKILPLVKDNVSCCGTNAYDPYTQLCCHDEVHWRSQDDRIKCCGKNVYDVKKEICCRGVSLPVKDVETAMCCYEEQQIEFD